MKHKKYKPSNGIDFDRPAYAQLLSEDRFSTLTKEREQELIAIAKIEITSLEAKLGKSITELIIGDAPWVGLNGNSSKNNYPALNELVERNLKLVVKYAPKIGRRYGLDKLESISEAVFAVYRAVKGYDPENTNPETNKPNSLGNYIMHWIIGSLHNLSRTDQGRLNGGESCRLQMREVGRITDRLFKSKGHKPSIEEIANELNKTAKPICTVDQLERYDLKEYHLKSRILFLRMLEKPENLPFDLNKMLEDFARANKTEKTDLIRLLEFPDGIHLEHSNIVLRQRLVTGFGIELRKALKSEPNDWINPYLRKYTHHEVYLLITQSRNLRVKELSAPLSEGFTLEDTVEGDEKQTESQDTLTELNEIITLSSISERELAVISARYLEGRTLDEIGNNEKFIQEHKLSETGKKRLTREMIRVIENKGMKKLQRAARRIESKVQ